MKNIFNEKNEFQIDMNDVRGKKLFIATPMYGAMCTGFYAKSLLDLNTFYKSYGMEFQWMNINNESLITRARNYCVESFLQSDCTHLLFVDADLEFKPIDVISMLALSDSDSDKHVLCGAYPKKNISWEKVELAVNKGVIEQNGDNPNVLENFIGDFVINPKHDSITMNKPFEVKEAGTGFMLIQREVFTKFTETHPENVYKPDHMRTEGFDGSKEITAFFLDPIDQEEKRHLSEDYYFCKEIQKIGLKVWICPWVSLNHTGTYKFVGDLGAVLSVGAGVNYNKKKGQKN